MLTCKLVSPNNISKAFGQKQQQQKKKTNLKLKSCHSQGVMRQTVFDRSCDPLEKNSQK